MYRASSGRRGRQKDSKYDVKSEKGMNWLRQIIRWLHDWDYRNPFDRTCRICHRHETKWCHPWQNALSRANGWWEVQRDGNALAHKNFWHYRQ